ncbi:GMC oxidoreductase [Dichomitus squalens]|uniref:GMC oxidoreductase n=1 Tax=Dichomitus squalens TaxID=114155 RepID=A0A4Q9MNS6_9APHY|nr:GMC oxidoreductase [Dichomitus squalens]
MEQKLAKVTDVAQKSFDFVVVGGGVSGCTIASRLSENPNVSVALLEAGNSHFDDPLVSVPDGWMQQVFDPEYDWVFRTTTQEKVVNNITTPSGGPDKSFFWSRGKGLGGSSALNFLFWTRPQREEIDAVEALGNPGWNWERYFAAAKRAETFLPSPANNFPEFRELYNKDSVGHSGPVPISFCRTVSGAELYFQKALEAHGVKTIDDGLGGSLNGTFKAAANIDPRTGTRSTAATGYIVPALDRPNLKVLTAAYVNRVLTKKEGDDVVATGVEFEHGGNVHVVHAAKEVILCASTVKSPHILELSGIGNRNVLEPLGIPVQVDLPSVGENLQDHLIFTSCVFKMKEEHGFVTSETITLPEVQAKLRSIYGEAAGPLSLACTGVTFLPLHTFSDRADELIEKVEKRIEQNAEKLSPGLKEQYELQLKLLKDKNVPDLEIVVFPVNVHPAGPPKPHIGLLPSIGHPFSRGTIHASSSDPKVQPTIDPNYLAEEIDIDILVESAKFIRKVTQDGPWKDVSEAELIPGANITTDEQLHEFVKTNVSTTWHSSGTCSLAPKEKGGVVDTHLKVYGTKNIRVADLSILPLLTVVHTQATTYGIAEQAADIIKADHSI